MLVIREVGTVSIHMFVQVVVPLYCRSSKQQQQHTLQHIVRTYEPTLAGWCAYELVIMLWFDQAYQ